MIYSNKITVYLRKNYILVMIQRLKFCLLFLAVLVPSEILARSANFMLTDKELSGCMINSLHQDRDGNIWISTENGLNRYDGTKVTVYTHDDDNPNSLSHNYVRYVFEDRAGNCYVGNYLGVQLYRAETDDFGALATYSDGSAMQSSPAFITETTDGQVIVSGNRACAVLLQPDGSLRYDSLAWDISDRMPGEVAWGKDGNLWFYIAKDAIYCVHRSGVLERRRDLLSHRDILNLIRDAEGNIYIQTVDKDLYAYDFETGDCRQLNRERISSSTIKCVLRFDSGHLLLGTDGNGVKLLDEQSGKVSDWEVDLPMLSSRYLKVHHIMRDRDGDLWLSLFLKGVARIPMHQSSFQYYGPQSLSTNLVGSSSISALAASKDGKIWVGTDGEGIYCLDPQAGTSSHFVSRTDGGTIPAIINTVFEDSEGTVWVGSYDEGCGRLDARTRQYQDCRDIFARRGIYALRVFGFAEDEQKRVWVATLGSGLYCYDLKHKRIVERLSFEENINLWTTSLLKTADNLLLVGTYDGAFMIDLKNPDPRPVQLLDRSIIYSLYEDDKHRLWAGSSVGLILFDRMGNRIATYTHKEGLSGNAAYSVIGDSEGTIWIGTDQGLSRFYMEKESFDSYTDADGLQGKSFSKNAACRDQQGRIWMGGTSGLNCFQPTLVSRRQVELQARVSGFYLHNKAVTANTLSGGKPVCEGAVGKATRYELNYDDNNFSIELATRQFMDAHQLRFQYSLEDTAWITLPMGSHLVNFSNLPVGEYRFSYRVLANQVASPVETLDVVIRPAWWETWQAKVCYNLLIFALLLGAAYMAYRETMSRRRELLLKHQEKVNAQKLEFFTRLMHEIRTPMSLLIGPLHKLIETDADPERQRMYLTMQRSADRLMEQADHMLGLDNENPDEQLVKVSTPLEENEKVVEKPVPAIKHNVELQEPHVELNTRAKYRMLIVDDDYEICEYLRLEMESDFRVETCLNGKEALDRIFRHAPDIIISDVMMPELDGFALCERVKSNVHLSHIPFVLLTALADTNSNLHGLGLGADAYLPKPFYIEVLRTTALNLLRNRVQLRNSLAGAQMQSEQLQVPKVKSFNDKLMERLLTAVNAHLSDPDFQIEMLCSEVGISRVHLYRKLKEITNQTPGDFVRNCRLRQAEQLLRDGNLSVQEVAEAVGFSKASNFSMAFKELYGYPPLKWKKMHGEENVKEESLT